MSWLEVVGVISHGLFRGAAMQRLFGKALQLSWQARGDLIRYSSLFRLLEAFVFISLSAVVGHLLSGRAVLDSTELVGFVLSPRGFAATFVSATLLLTIRLIEQVGLTAIVLGAEHSNRVPLHAVLPIVVARLPRLLTVAAWILVVGLVVAAPLLLVASFILLPLLSKHDINYYLAERPPEFVNGAAVILGVAATTVAVSVWLAVRWRLVVPGLLCERGTARDLLRSSARLVRGHWLRAGTGWVFTAVVVVGLGLLSAWVGRLCAVGASRLVGSGAGAHFGVFALVLLVRTVLTSLITMPGSCLSAAIFASLYRDLRRAQEPDWTPAFIHEAGAASRSFVAAWTLGLLPVMSCSVAAVSTFLAMGQLYADRPVAVTAHRGATTNAIENTVAAVREAIEAGAQFAEIDVQVSRDDILVVTHDSDFSRLAGDARKVWDLTCDEIKGIALTRSTSGTIPADVVPTLDEVLEAARGRIGVNIELKYYEDHQPHLAERVVEAVRVKRMEDQVIIQSLHYEGLEEVRRVAPKIPIGYLFSVNAREPKRLDVNFLSVQIGRVDSAFVNAAHRRGQEVHVWTVDKTADMERMIDLGVDSLITNQPQVAAKLARAHAQLSATERTVKRLRAWLSE